MRVGAGTGMMCMACMPTAEAAASHAHPRKHPLHSIQVQCHIDVPCTCGSVRLMLDMHVRFDFSVLSHHCNCSCGTSSATSFVGNTALQCVCKLLYCCCTAAQSRRAVPVCAYHHCLLMVQRWCPGTSSSVCVPVVDLCQWTSS